MPKSGNRTQVCDALYVSWKLVAGENGETGEDIADLMRRAITSGEDRNLYRLRSWMVAKGEVRALIIPEAPLEEIADALWAPVAPPIATRWIAGQRKCAVLTHQIENAPVEFGLASRPEEWPFSSAFRD
jgi:hypothetical protein